MRKKTTLAIIDTILWLVIALIPVFAYLLQYVSGNPTFSVITEFETFMENFTTQDNNVFYNFFMSLFNMRNGIAVNTGVITFLTWFTMAELMHLAVDFILFIPRWAMEVFEKYAK